MKVGFGQETYWRKAGWLLSCCPSKTRQQKPYSTSFAVALSARSARYSVWSWRDELAKIWTRLGVLNCRTSIRKAAIEATQNIHMSQGMRTQRHFRLKSVTTLRIYYFRCGGRMLLVNFAGIRPCEWTVDSTRAPSQLHKVFLSTSIGNVVFICSEAYGL